MKCDICKKNKEFNSSITFNVGSNINDFFSFPNKTVTVFICRDCRNKTKVSKLYMVAIAKFNDDKGGYY